MTRTQDPFEYDVAISYALEDKETAEELVRGLEAQDITVFRDEYLSPEASHWGRQMIDHLVNLYDRKARYCVLLISRHYPLESWTESERRSAQERALRDANEYILPVQLDDTDVPGINETPGYVDLRPTGPGGRRHGSAIGEVLERLAGKLRQDDERPGPPRQSHDLRSGNVPSTDDQEHES